MYAIGYWFRRILRLQPSKNDILISALIREMAQNPDKCEFIHDYSPHYFRDLILNIGRFQLKADEKPIFRISSMRNNNYHLKLPNGDQIPISRMFFHYMRWRYKKMYRRPVSWKQIKRCREREKLQQSLNYLLEDYRNA